MINLLINFATQKTGGGQNVALNFLYAIAKNPLSDVNCYYLVAKDSQIHRYLEKQGSKQYIIVSQNPVLRILFEFFLGWFYLNKLKINIVYSYFGYAWFPKRYPQISGSADSNLYFPEIDFWYGYRGINRLKKTLVDYYRICGVKRSSAVVFENEALEERGRSIYSLLNTCVIKPSIFVNENKLDFKLPCNVGKEVKRGLFLCGWHLNKKIMLIPLLAAELRTRKRPFAFFLTAPLDNSEEHKQFCELVRLHNVEDMVFITGPVHKDELSSLYTQIDYVFLLSKLESFSNNIIEAWFFRKPLLVADELWSRSICKEAAIYVNRDSVTDIADKLCFLLDSNTAYDQVIERGAKILHEYPTIQDRIKQEMEYIKYVFKHN